MANLFVSGKLFVINQRSSTNPSDAIQKQQPALKRQLLLLSTIALFFSLILSPRSVLAASSHPAELLQALQAAASTQSFSDKFTAQVWLVDMSNRLKRFIPNAHARLRLLKQVHIEASKHQLMPELVLAVIEVESHFKADAVSVAGAQGLMQVMPFWKKEIGRSEDNLFDMRTNLSYGCTILAYYLKKEANNLTRALARYNGSIGRTKYPERVMRAWVKHWQPG
ncbi:MAG: hypothetical protein CMI12_11130 [Oceanospirillum sp.]|nr:hypothetical protein [Oceanospirillum sp.]